MARMLKKENVDWEVTRKVLDSAADLTLAEMSFRPQLSASCCSIPTDVAWFDASDT